MLSSDALAAAPLCTATERMRCTPQTSAAEGTIRYAPVKSAWISGMWLATLLIGPFVVTPGAIALYLVTTATTLCLGHSIGMHRLLVHRSFEAKRPIEYLLVYLGTLVGMAGPFGMVKLHDLRDWAQRQKACHDMLGNRSGLVRDALLQMHCRIDLTHPPRFVGEPRLIGDPVYRFLDATRMAQQIPWAILFFWIGGLPWLVWGIPARIATSLTEHWLVVHLTHRNGPQGWVVDGESVQGHDLPQAAWLTFGEAWHSTHHAWPQSARLGVEPGQADLGWRVLKGLRRLGLVWDLKEPRDLMPRAGVRRAA